MNLNEILTSSEASYIIGGTLAVTSAAFYYLGSSLSKKRLRYREMDHAETLKELENRSLEQKSRLELEKQKQEGLEKENIRKLQVDEIKRIEISADRKERQNLIAKILPEIKSSLDAYIADMKEHSNYNDIIKSREEYRQSLVDKLIAYIESGEDNSIFSSNISIDNDDEEKIKKLVDLKFPISEIQHPELPKKLRILYDIVSQEFDGDSDVSHPAFLHRSNEE